MHIHILRRQIHHGTCVLLVITSIILLINWSQVLIALVSRSHPSLSLLFAEYAWDAPRSLSLIPIETLIDSVHIIKDRRRIYIMITSNNATIPIHPLLWVWIAGDSAVLRNIHAALSDVALYFANVVRLDTAVVHLVDPSQWLRLLVTVELRARLTSGGKNLRVHVPLLTCLQVNLWIVVGENVSSLARCCCVVNGSERSSLNRNRRLNEWIESIGDLKLTSSVWRCGVCMYWPGVVITELSNWLEKGGR